MLSTLSVVIGAIAALVALAGLYIVVPQSIGERLREFAIRMAMGATGPARTILRYVCRVAAVGLAADALLTGWSAGLVAAYQLRVSARDPLTLLAPRLR